MLGDHRNLHVLTLSFPTLRSSDLIPPKRQAKSSRLCRSIFRIGGRMESLLIDHSRRRIGKVALRTGQADRDPARHDQDEEAERAPRGGLVHAGESRSGRSEEHTSELQSLMRNSYAVFCLKK